MTLNTQKTSRSLQDMQAIIEDIENRMEKLGLGVSVWDTTGQKVSGRSARCDFCAMFCPAHSGCEACERELTQRVIAEDKPLSTFCEHGCCFIASPIHKRRRVLGVVAACYPTRELLDDEEKFARMCDDAKLDSSVMRRYAEQDCRHNADEAEDFLNILHWMLKHELDAKTSQQEIATFSNNLSSTYEELSLLYSVSGSMRVTQKPNDFVQNVCEELFEVVGASIAAVIDARPPAVDEDISIVVGSDSVTTDQFRTLANQIIAPRLAKSGGPIVDNDMCDKNEFGIRNMIAIPLSHDSDQNGMIVGFNKAHDFDTVDMKLLNSIGNQAAVFLSNNRLYADLQDLLMGVLHSLTASIDAKDPYTCGHSQRVALLSRKIAEAYGYGSDELRRIYLSGLLHDVGKIGVPEHVLCKPGKLTDEEFESIKRHPLIGARIIGGIRQLDDIVPGILMHHERLDGRGYPQKLSEDKLPMIALIIGLADCFDAMTSDRTYRKALPLKVVREEIERCSGKQFHPDLVKVFLAMDLEKVMEELYSPAKTVFPANIMQEH